MTKKPSLQSSFRELQCIGRLEIARSNPVGFLCGCIPVSTDKAFHEALDPALIPSRQIVSAPRYQLLPMDTDLNQPPLVTNIPEKVLPVRAVESKVNKDISSNHSRKCEALAISGLVEYGDEIDVIAPTEILKEIFSVPYSKAQVSITVHRVGQTLVLNKGFDIEGGEKLSRRHSNQSKCADQSLFLNFAMHSVRKEDCDNPPVHHAVSERQSNSSFLGGEDARKEEFEHCSEDSQVKKKKRKNKRNKDHDPVIKASNVGEKPGCSIEQYEKYRRTVGNDDFVRVLHWQFHDFRMLLGSDLLLFSNDKYIATSLHLWDVKRQVTPLTWLETWLDNVMASVPELAICYHENGVVQRSEVLKTEDIFILKGISEDGTPAFHPHVVQKNGLSVLRFLKENCKQDPCSYWLYKNSGEDVIQLFDISVIPTNHSSTACDESSSSPPLVHRRRSDTLFSLGTLLCRIAHRLSLSTEADKKAKSAMFFKQCLDFLDEPDHLVLRAFAHEQLARLILDNEDLELSSEPLLVESGIDAQEEEEKLSKTESALQDLSMEASDFRQLIASDDPEIGDEEDMSSSSDESFAVVKLTASSTSVLKPVSDSISYKLAAVHHVSEAIKCLRWMRQLQGLKEELVEQGVDQINDRPPSVDLSVCSCGDPECIEICGIREFLPTMNLDNQLWKLVLLIGETYLALGQAHKEDGQLHQTLKIVELASSVYGSMPQHLEDTKFISSMTKNSSPQLKYLFWAKAWTLVADVYVEFHIVEGREMTTEAAEKLCSKELRLPSVVVKEVKRLKKKVNQSNKICSSCSLVNCSCEIGRAISGSSASSSNGCIFKYLEGPIVEDFEHNLSAALICYEEARKALHGLPTTSVEFYSILKKKGWVCNELGQYRLEKKEFIKAEIAFADAINALTEASDHTSIVLINCNLGHVRLTLAEDMVVKAESFKLFPILYFAYKQALEAAKLEYRESLRFYGAAKMQLTFLAEESSSVSKNLRHKVYTELGNTYLRLGVLLARENTTAEVYENTALEDVYASCAPRAKDMNKHEISANDAIREAISVYESVGDLCKEEVACAYFQLACYQRDCCKKLLESNDKKNNLAKAETNNVQRLKQYASLAKRNWQKAMDFYGPEMHPTMYLTILMETAALSSNLSSPLHSNAMMESALSSLLEGRHISDETFAGSLSTDDAEQVAKFWKQLQMLLKTMLSMALNTNRSSQSGRQNPSSQSRDAGKLKELYKMSLKWSGFSDLHAMHSLWTA